MIKAIIFDCFGVLITDVFDKLLQSFRVTDPTKANKIISLVQATNQGLLSRQDFTAQTATIMGISPHELRNRISNGEAKNAALFEVIPTLRRSYKTAVLSNVSHEGFWSRFTPDELIPYFDTIVLSGDIGVAKPDSAAYTLTATRLGIKAEECLMVDDREEYLAGAKLVNMQTVLYKSVSELLQYINRLN